MPPKKIFKKSDIIDSSLKIVKEKGFKQLSAREVARELISSTRPVYEHFQSMNELKKTVLQMTVDLLYDYVTTAIHEKCLPEYRRGICFVCQGS